jgi:hypothetical protein
MKKPKKLKKCVHHSPVIIERVIFCEKCGKKVGKIVGKKTYYDKEEE